MTSPPSVRMVTVFVHDGTVERLLTGKFMAWKQTIAATNSQKFEFYIFIKTRQLNRHLKRERERTQVRRHLKTWQKMEENVSTVCIYNTRQRKNSKKNKNKTKGCGYSLTRTWFFLIGHIYIYKNYKSGRPHFLVQGFFFYFFFFRFSICDSHPKETYWHWIICQSILILT